MKLYNDKKELKNAIIHVSLALFVICLLVAPAVAILMLLVFVFGGFFIFGIIAPISCIFSGRDFNIFGNRNEK